MQTLVPFSDRKSWSVTGVGRTNDGALDDVTIAVDRGSPETRFSIQTMRRTGTRLGPRGSVHWTSTGAIAIASLAAGCLLLDALPFGTPKSDGLATMREALERADALARDTNGWDATALSLDGIDYALFTRNVPEGTIAHADLGWATIAMWSRGPLHEGPFRLADVEPDADLSLR